MPDEAIEKDAQALLAGYANARGVSIEAPIAVDDIIEKHLKIGIEFDKTHWLFGVPRSGIGSDPYILGAIFFEQMRIVIDESLDPDERFESRNPSAAFSDSDDKVLENFAGPFAEKFLVSPIAMRIRLEKLGLLHRTVPLQRLLSDGA